MELDEFMASLTRIFLPKRIKRLIIYATLSLICYLVWVWLTSSDYPPTAIPCKNKIAQVFIMFMIYYLHFQRLCYKNLFSQD